MVLTDNSWLWRINDDISGFVDDGNFVGEGAARGVELFPEAGDGCSAVLSSEVSVEFTLVITVSGITGDRAMSGTPEMIVV